VKRSVALLACLLTGCSGSEVATTGRPFDPVQFFAGHTQGEASLRLITGASHRVSVDSRGTADRHGGLVLDQAIREAGKPERTRRWVFRPAGPGRWTGTLTDAVGPVTVERTSVDVAIRYTMHNGENVEQHLQLPPGGAVYNHLTVSRFGIRLATLDEKIRKVP
jgi:Protein of unknown function (DUF3833)